MGQLRVLADGLGRKAMDARAEPLLGGPLPENHDCKSGLLVFGSLKCSFSL